MLLLATIWSVAVFCGPIGSTAEGEFLQSQNIIVLSNSNCQILKHPKRFPLYMDAGTVFVLAHEEGHAHDPQLSPQQICGVIGPCELFADCYGAAHVYAVARTLGYSRKQARRYYNWAHSHRRTISAYAPIPQHCWHTL